MMETLYSPDVLTSFQQTIWVLIVSSGVAGMLKPRLKSGAKNQVYTMWFQIPR